jgi:hypothetical protein
MDNENQESENVTAVNRKPGACIPWEEAKERMGEIQGDEELVKRIWEENDGAAYAFIWQCLLSF